LENFKMALNDSNTTLLFSEILDKVHKAKNKYQKVDILRQFDHPSLRMIIKASFDPTKEWVIPSGEVPYRVNDAPAGTEHTVLTMEAKKLWHFIKGGDNDTKQARLESMFIQMCEGLHSSEAKLLCDAKDKKLHQVYKGLSKDVVKEAFGWDDNFMIPEPAKYPQAPGTASGV
tara:strand:- start:997 stop:1515 length:519 start_codon:yes stop_codon:yes gene_type:complete